MDGSNLEDPLQKIGFFLVPGFSFIAFSSAVEPLRLANRVANSQLYGWSCYSRDGQPVEASNAKGVQHGVRATTQHNIGVSGA